MVRIHERGIHLSITLNLFYTVFFIDIFDKSKTKRSKQKTKRQNVKVNQVVGVGNWRREFKLQITVLSNLSYTMAYDVSTHVHVKLKYLQTQTKAIPSRQ